MLAVLEQLPCHLGHRHAAWAVWRLQYGEATLGHVYIVDALFIALLTTYVR